MQQKNKTNPKKARSTHR